MGITRKGGTRRITVDGFRPVVEFRFEGRRMAEGGLTTLSGKIAIEKNGNGVTVRKSLDPFEHVVGFGEKAFDIERKRLVLRMWNNDPGGYRRGTDPIYASIPFFMCVGNGVTGFFVNSVSEVIFDTGVTEYDQLVVRTRDSGLEMFVFEGKTVESVVEQFVALTGMPFLPPRWSLGHQASRFSYYPESSVLRIAEEYRKRVPLDAIYLDIDYMDGFKLFTWNRRIFSDPAGMVKKLHSGGTKAVAIMDPGLKAEQGYSHFENGIGNYVETANRELYLGKVWPGLCAFPDFFREGAAEHWKGMISSFVRENGLDGIWLDMNEPSVFNEGKTIPPDSVHIHRGEAVPHAAVHNAYAYLEAKATYEALKDVTDEPFILSRSGYAGIQKYAAMWTGDSTSSWDDLRLQISMVSSMGISGIPFAGCDLGGFMGRTDPELLARYYQMAAFFPIFRNHKAKDGSDQEIFLLPERYRDMAEEAVRLRYRFLPYLYSLAYEAHTEGHPVVRPLFYEFQDDTTAYAVNDEYLVGPSLLYAPVVEKGEEGREVYLPRGKWFSLSGGVECTGPAWIKADGPTVFVRKGSVVPVEDGGYLVYGRGTFTLFDGAEHRAVSDGASLDAGMTVGKGYVTFLAADSDECEVDGRKARAAREGHSTSVRAANFRRVRLV